MLFISTPNQKKNTKSFHELSSIIFTSQVSYDKIHFTQNAHWQQIIVLTYIYRIHIFIMTSWHAKFSALVVLRVASPLVTSGFSRNRNA